LSQLFTVNDAVPETDQVNGRNSLRKDATLQTSRTAVRRTGLRGAEIELRAF